jgi:hypothetical protein
MQKTKNKLKKIHAKLTAVKPKAIERETIKIGKLQPIPKMELAIKPDYNKLILLLQSRTHSYSETQDKFIAKLKDYFINLGADSYTDTYGNLYVVKGKAEMYPCVVAHTDINQDKVNNVNIITSYPWIIGMNADNGEQCGLGADDKVGIYFAVHMFDMFDNIKLFFPKDEEVGLVGTYKSDEQFFTDCTMIVQLDRRSYTNDLISFTNGLEVFGEEFKEASKDLCNKYMYKVADGICTDVGGIKKFKSVTCVAMNVSCGYIREHSDSEAISIPHFENAINFGYELLKLGADKKWEHIVPVYESTYNFNSYYGKNYFGYDFDADTTIGNQTAKSQTFNMLYGKVTITNDNLSQDAYIFEMYPELVDPALRNKCLNGDFPEMLAECGSDMDNIQTEIDDCLADGYCPSCGAHVEPNNRLLLNVDCENCFSTFNLIDYDTLYAHIDNAV